MPESSDETRGTPTSGGHITCPACGSIDLVPILYGMPIAMELFDAARAGELVLGGCLRDDESAWHCRSCGANSQDQPRPSQFAMFDINVPVEDIVAWTGADVTDAQEMSGSAEEAVMTKTEDYEPDPMVMSYEELKAACIRDQGQAWFDRYGDASIEAALWLIGETGSGEDDE